MATDEASRIQLVGPSILYGGGGRVFRAIIDDKHFKKFRIEGPVVRAWFTTFKWPKFPPLEAGWEEARLSQNPVDGSFYFSEWKDTLGFLPRLENKWHPVSVDCRDVSIWESQCSSAHKGKMASTPTRDYGSSDLAPGSWIILKSMVWAHTLILRDKVMGENNVYQHIHGLGIGPDFLGHVVEEDRTTGFLLKYIQNFRIAESRDLDLCTQALSKLHALGIVHGNISKWNFLVHDNDTKVTIVDFGQSKRGLPEDLEAEMKLLPVKLQGTYPRTTDLDDQPIWESDPFTLDGNPVFSEEFKEPSDLA